MKQTIEIEVPDGKKAVWKDGRIIFEDIKPPLPKTWKEFCYNNDRKPNEAFIANSSEIQLITEHHERKSSCDQNILPSERAAKQHLALMQLHQLRDCYRQGWIPDWENNSYKYSIIRKDKQYSIAYYFSTPCFLSFPTCEIAEEFLNNFKDLIEQAGDLI